ncbi:MAG: sulfatase-like hydrolase/transferase [Lentisphaeria bacterium]|nr:sulfatase-like hydrolase/transferase [Lentisphaeria bacterium]
MSDNRDLPNVLLIMTDQHRADWMSCAGDSPVPTPNLDRIAARGVRFANAYCPYPVCVASRMAMLSGLYAHTTGAINNDTDHLDWRYRTLAHHFSEHGFLSALIGKMHFGDAHKHGFEYSLGINDWLMYLGPAVAHYADEIASNPHNREHFLRTMFDTGAGFPDVYDLWDGRGSPWRGQVTQHDFRSVASRIPARDQLDMFVARESVKFLERYRDQRFFLVASFMKPHTPLFPPREWAEQYPVEAMELPLEEDLSGYPEHLQRRCRRTRDLDPLLWRANAAGYRGNLAFVDHCVGVLLDGVERLGLLRNTLVIYTSDHGDMTGQHGLLGKFCLFEPSVKVPLILSHQGRLPEGRCSPALVNLLGLMPTLAELCGTAAPGTPARLPLPGAPALQEGISFAAAARDPAAPGAEAVFSEYDLRGRISSYMVRARRFKFVHHEGGSCHELYDLETDPREDHNRVGDPALRHVRQDLERRLREWYDPAGNPYGATR